MISFSCFSYVILICVLVLLHVCLEYPSTECNMRMGPTSSCPRPWLCLSLCPLSLSLFETSSQSMSISRWCRLLFDLPFWLQFLLCFLASHIIFAFNFIWNDHKDSQNMTSQLLSGFWLCQSMYINKCWSQTLQESETSWVD